MNSQKRSQRKQRRSRPASQTKGLDFKARVIPGPVPRKPRALDMVLRSTGFLTSSGGGVIVGSMNNNPSSSAEWSTVVALYDSYRIKKMTFEFIPYLTFESGNDYPSLAVCFDPDSTSNLSGFSNALGYDNFRALDMSKHWHYEAFPPRISSAAALTGAYTVYENGFIDCASPPSTSAILWYAGGATVGTTYGTYVFHWDVEFVSRH
jgi:hypothetical protein